MMSDEYSFNSSGEGCPEWNPAWPIGDWPETNKTLGLVLFIIHMFVLVGSLAYMFQRRNQEPYRSRNPGLVAVSAIALATMVSTLSLREFLGRENFPCDVLLWFGYLSVGLWLGPFSVQLLQLKNRLDWQMKLSSMPLQLPEGVSFSEYVTSKYRSSHTRAYLSMALLCLVMIIITFSFSQRQPIYYRGCTGCDNTLDDFMIFSLFVIICLSLIFYAIRVLPKPSKGQAARPLVRQLMHHFKYHMPIYVLYIVLILMDPGKMHASGEFSWNHLLVVLLTLFTFQDVAYPGLIQQQTRASKPEIRLINVIQDPVLLEMFENHLMSEFSLENLRFYFEAIAVKSDCPTGKDNTFEAREAWCQRAYGVYLRFLANDALLAVNVSARAKRKIQQRLDVKEANPNASSKNLRPALRHIGSSKHLRTENSVRALFSRTSWMHADVFDEAVLEVFRLMEMDSFSRFYDNNKEMLLDLDVAHTAASTGEGSKGNSKFMSQKKKTKKSKKSQGGLISVSSAPGEAGGSSFSITM